MLGAVAADSAACSTKKGGSQGLPPPNAPYPADSCPWDIGTSLAPQFSRTLQASLLGRHEPEPNWKAILGNAVPDIVPE